MKSYTDLEQSKRLAEILPFESADMHYWRKGKILGVGHSKEMQEGFESKGIDYTPCWSLASLLNVLPEGTRLLKAINISSVGDTKYHCDCPKGNINEWFDNPVDAFYNMILKLHELKML